MRAPDDGDEIGRGRLFFFFKQVAGLLCFVKMWRSTETRQSSRVETEERIKLIRFVAHLSLQVYRINIIIHPFIFSRSSNTVMPQNNKENTKEQSELNLPVGAVIPRPLYRQIPDRMDVDATFCCCSTSFFILWRILRCFSSRLVCKECLFTLLRLAFLSLEPSWLFFSDVSHQ